MRIFEILKYFKFGDIKQVSKVKVGDIIQNIIIKYTEATKSNYIFTNENIKQLEKKRRKLCTQERDLRKQDVNIPKKLLDEISIYDEMIKKEVNNLVYNFLYECENYIKEKHILDFTYKEKISTQLEYLGFINLTTNKEEDRRKLIITDVIPLKNKSTGTPWGYAVFAKSIGSGKSSRLTVKADLFNDNPLEKMDIIYARCLDKNKSGYWYLLDYEKILE